MEFVKINRSRKKPFGFFLQVENLLFIKIILKVYEFYYLYITYNKDKYNNSVHLIRNEKLPRKLKEGEMLIYFDLFSIVLYQK